MDLGDAIAAIYAAAGDEEQLNALPALFADAAGARSGTLQFFSNDWALKEAFVSYFSPEMVSRYIETDLWRLDPWRAPTIHGGPWGRAIALDELVPVESLQRSTFYNENFRFWGDDTARCIGAVLQLEGGFASIGLHRAAGAEPFTETDVAAVQALIPHYERMARLRERLTGAAHRLALTEAVLDQEADAVFVVDHDARPLYMNRAARALADTRTGLRLSRVGLSALGDADAQKLRRAITTACARSGPQGGALQIACADGPPLRLIVTPLAAGRRTHALVTANRFGASGAGAAVIADLYGFTRAEAETASLLSQGRSPAEVSDLRQVSLATVRTQIRDMLRKSDASGIAELAAMIAGLPRRQE